jgi:hypothetical protein
MSAEVVILNTRGIALAADSAVTLGVGKIYNTADKLFALSKYHPVGIMTYGAANIMGINCGVIFKSYRDSLGDRSFDKLSDYAEDFINYLAEFPYFTEEQELDYLKSMCDEIFSGILTCVLEDLYAEFDGKDNINFSRIYITFNESLKGIRRRIEEIEDEKVVKPDFDFIDKHHEIVQKRLGFIFEEYPLSEKQIAEIIEIFKLVFQKGKEKIENYTGIVIAGYGEKEIFPAIYSFKVSGKLGDSLIYFDIKREQINVDTNTACIAPFAQYDVVIQFVDGVDRSFKAKVIEEVHTILSRLSPLINDPNKEKATAISDLLTKYVDDLSEKVFADPILDTVEHMQTSELTSMAEAMVNLTALKRHVSTDEESVGGPIDVALITRGEGFIWIKRKTNYDPHLNRDLHQNYFREAKNGNL